VPAPDRPDLLRAILTSHVYDVAHETPLEPAPRLSARLGRPVLFKREDMQPIFSFKLRGAYNRMAHLDEAERRRGVITASAGNHAQGVAYSARHLGLSAVIVMPETTPAIKVDAVRDLGAEVVLHGDSYADAQTRCDALAASTGRVFIHPFDDPLVIAGQGTVAMEILRQHLGRRAAAVFVPVGGGGLIAGIAAWYAGAVRVIGVEPERAPTLQAAQNAGRPVDVEVGGVAADSLGARRIGAHAFEIAKAYVAGVLLVTDEAILAAQRHLWEAFRIVAEPGAAAGTAALLSSAYAPGLGERVAVIVNGANTTAVKVDR
jgi:threonine dehydratase